MVFVVALRELNLGNPHSSADAFILDQGGMVSKDERSVLAVQWPLLDRKSKVMLDSMRATLSEAERRAFAGFIPVTFHFKATQLVAFHQYPLYRLRGHECGPPYEYPLISENEELFSDVARIWGLVVNRGVVVRARRDDEPDLMAEVLVWSWKHWTWSPADSEWDTHCQDVVLDAPEPSHYRSGLSPSGIYRRYHEYLTLHRNFE